MRTLKTLASIVAASMLFAACSSVKLDSAAPIEERNGTAIPADMKDKSGTETNSAAAGSADASKSNGTNDARNDPLNDPASILAKRSVYFDIDSYVVKDEFKPVVEAHAKYLIAHPDRKVIIQGNTDERGGSEYNLALGQKRAEAVRRALALLGVPDTQMEAVSFGKEKPKASGSNDAAWAENRRSDIAY
jgi:peptidoglycan-associated lipoprotein